MAITPLVKSVQCVADSVAINAAVQASLTATVISHVYGLAIAIKGNKAYVTYCYD